MPYEAISIAHKCLERAAEAEKIKDREQANVWRAKSAECFRIAADPSVPVSPGCSNGTGA